MAEGKSLDAIAVDLLKSILKAHEDDQRRLKSERIFKNKFWTYWETISWIAFRDPLRLHGIDENNYRRDGSWYQSIPTRVPREALFEAVMRDDLTAVKPSGGVPAHHWLGKRDIDHDASFDSQCVRQLWPRWLTWNEAVEVVGGPYAAAGQRLVELLSSNNLDLHALVPNGNPSNPRKRVRVVEVKPGATKSEVTVVIADDVVVEGRVVLELRSGLLARGTERISADRLLFAEPALRATLFTEPAAAVGTSTSAIPTPSEINSPAPAAKTRTARGRKPDAIWAHVEVNILETFRNRGPLDPDMQDWRYVADVEQAINDYLDTTLDEDQDRLGETTIRRHAKELILWAHVERHIADMFRDLGPLASGKPDWETQADVERVIVELLSENGAEFREDAIGRHAKHLISRYGGSQGP